MDGLLQLNNSCPGGVNGLPGQLFMTMLNVLVNAQCTLDFKNEYPEDYSDKLKDLEEFDYIVVGSGASGSAVANKLTENNIYKVLVLESGGLPSTTSEIPSLLFSLQGTNEDWQYSTVPKSGNCEGFKGKSCAVPRGKLLGGSTSINAMLYVRGNKRDYDNWAELGNPGWDWDSVLKIYKSFENVPDDHNGVNRYGKGGFLDLDRYISTHPLRGTIRNAAGELGYETMSSEPNLGYFEALTIIKNGIRQNSAKSFLGKIKNRKNLYVSLNSHVNKLVLKDKICKGVVVKIGSETKTILARKEVILSAGAINTPQILMLSGIGPKSHLEERGIDLVQDLKVGENLQDHLFYPGFMFKLHPKTVPQFHPLHAIDEMYRYFMYRDGEMGTISLTNFLGFINTKKNSRYPNLELHHVFQGQNDRYLLPEMIRAGSYDDAIAAAQVEANKEAPTANFYPILLNPKSRGRITLKSNDPQDKPLIDLNLLDDKEDEEVLLEGIRYSEKMLRTKNFSKHHPQIVDLDIPNCREFEFQSDDYYKCALRNLGTTLFHPVGTCKMGPHTDNASVVDSRLRVHGVGHLRVVDASIMPLITSGNTMAPSIMIGFKGGEMILEDAHHKVGHMEL